MLDDLRQKMAKQEGAIEFCKFLRGRVPPEQLLAAWEAYNGLSTAEIVLPVPNSAAKCTGRELMREGGLI